MRVFARKPIDARDVKLPHGQVHLIPERCKGCGICVALCPREVLRISEDTNAKGYHLPEIDPDSDGDCVNCEFCTMVCPEFAIFTMEVGE